MREKRQIDGTIRWKVGKRDSPVFCLDRARLISDFFYKHNLPISVSIIIGVALLLLLLLDLREALFRAQREIKEDVKLTNSRSHLEREKFPKILTTGYPISFTTLRKRIETWNAIYRLIIKYIIL